MTYEIVEKFLKDKIWQSAVLNFDQLCFSLEVRKACECNYCGRYKKSWSCPPGVGSIEELKEKYAIYNKAFVFTTKHAIEDSYDFEGMTCAQKEHAAIERALKKELDKKGCDYKILGTGSCDLCEKCTYPDTPCRFPDVMTPSVESCGIDVTDLAKKGNINYRNGENTVTYFSLVFYN